MLPALLLGVMLLVVCTVPFVNKMPYNIQRALSFLPVSIDSETRQQAQGSLEWRVQIWKAVLPQVPQYFFKGKGLAMSRADLDFSMSSLTGTMKESSEDQSWAALASDYHNGPLSVLIPFGVWGAAAFIWFLWAGGRVLYRNYKFGS